MKGELLFELDQGIQKYRLVRKGSSDPSYNDVIIIEKLEEDHLGGPKWVEAWKFAKESRHEELPINVRFLVEMARDRRR